MLLPYLADFSVNPPPHGQIFWGLLVLVVVPLLLLGMAFIHWMGRSATGDEGSVNL